MRLEEANMLYKYASLIREESSITLLRTERAKTQYQVYIAAPKHGIGRRTGLSEVVEDLTASRNGEMCDGGDIDGTQ